MTGPPSSSSDLAALKIFVAVPSVRSGAGRALANRAGKENISRVPVIVALIVAVIGLSVLYRMDFVQGAAVRNNGIRKISREALARAAPSPRQHH